MHELNANSLEMVKEELIGQCQILADTCQAYQLEPGEDLANTLRAQLVAMRGACQILEVQSVVLLCEELESLFRDHADKLIDNDDFFASLATIMKVLRGYLGFIFKRETDQPLLLLPEINTVRRTAGKSLLTEAHFLDTYLPQDNIIAFINEKSADIRLVLRRSRHLFQQGLVHAIRGTGQTGAFRIMSHAVRRVHETLGDEAEKRYWLLAFQVMEAMAKRSLVVDKAKLQTLMAIERQLRQLVKGNSELERCYPPTLQRTLMAYLLLADLKNDAVTRLFQQLNISPAPFNDQQIKADRALLGSEGEQSFSDTMSLMRDKIDEIAILIQTFEDGDLEQPRDHFLPLALGIADICGLSGLAKGATLFSDYAQQLQDAKTSSVEESLVSQIIDSVLYLECLLLEIDGQPPTVQQLAEINNKSTQEVIESNIAKHAHVQVVDEVKSKLRDVMLRLTDLQEGVSGFALNDDFHEVFDSISGAMRLLELEKASRITRQCSQYARSGKLLIDVQDESLMAAFADVLVSLEYYLDNCRWNKDFDDSVLDIAEECLEQLK